MQDRAVLREYARQWMNCANLPAMVDRKRIWTALNDLKPYRPAVLVETALMTDYVTDSELSCENGYLRQIEKYMIENIRHAREIGDDFVLEPFMRIPWDFAASSFGVDINTILPVDSCGSMVAYRFDHPIKTIEDVGRLKKRTFSVDREKSLMKQELLTDLFGDILTTKLGGIDPVYGADGYSPFCGLHITEITLNLYKLIGMDNLYFWLYDEPETIHYLMQLMLDDFKAYHSFLEQQNLLTYNGDYTLTGGRYGYASDSVPEGELKLKDLWLWCNAEETTTLSPEMYKQFIMPYIKQSAELFGKTYFGCCENIESRWDQIKQEIPNLKAVSVSPFSNVSMVGELIGKDYILSKKPHSAYLSYREPDWESAKKDIMQTLAATKGGNLEIILRDVYRQDGKREVYSEWVNMVKANF